MDYESEDWPARHLPSRLAADRGEMVSNKAGVVAEIGIKVEIMPSMRPDRKGKVESTFRSIKYDNSHYYIPGKHAKAPVRRESNGKGTLPSSQQGFDTTAYISWINGKHAMPASEMMNMLPGEYEFQVGLGCSNSATCRPSRAYKIIVKAGYRYVLTPDGIFVSDRAIPRSQAGEKLYQP